MCERVHCERAPETCILPQLASAQAGIVLQPSFDQNVHDQHREEEHGDEEADLKIPLGKLSYATAFALDRRGSLQHSVWWCGLKRREITTCSAYKRWLPVEFFLRSKGIFSSLARLGQSPSLPS